MKTVIVLSAFVIAAGCSGGHLGEKESKNSSLESKSLLACKQLTLDKGSIGNEQSPATLATRELSGRQDVWEHYVEFSQSSSAIFEFALPKGKSSHDVSNLSLRSNYRGPKKRDMIWEFEAYDHSKNKWYKITDNGFAEDWRWSANLTPLPSPVTRFFDSNGILKIRYRTLSSKEKSQLDELNIIANYSKSSDDEGDDGEGNDDDKPGSIWRPLPGMSWQWQITETIDSSLNVQMYDVDLFETSAQTIASLKARGIKVICYFDTAYESYRPDSSEFTPEVLGNDMDGWPGQKWVDIRSPVIRSIMSKRIALAAEKKCDGIEPDDVDPFYNDPGFDFTASDQLDFIRFLAKTAHEKNLSIGLKNNLDQVKDLVNDVDFAVNEECFKYDECDLLKPFIDANKAVFQVEYGNESLKNSVCPKANSMNFDTLIKNLDLDAWRISCR